MMKHCRKNEFNFFLFYIFNNSSHKKEKKYCFSLPCGLMQDRVLPPELWDLILTFLSEIDIKTMAKYRLLSDYFNLLILNNRNLKYKLLLFENGFLFQYPFEQFRWACEKGHLELAKWLVMTFKLTKKFGYKTFPCYSLYQTCENGHLEVAKWLKEAFKFTKENLEYGIHTFLFLACQHGYLEIAKWLTESFGITTKDARSRDNCAFTIACANGHLEVVKWLVKSFRLTSEDVRNDNDYALCEARVNGHSEVVKWLENTFNLK